jgi:hypothetical protein
LSESSCSLSKNLFGKKCVQASMRICNLLLVAL